MRLAGYVALEIGTLALIGGIGVMSARLVRAGAAHAAESGVESGSWNPGSGALEPGRLHVLESRAGTFLGVEDEILLEQIRTPKVLSAKLNKGGSSISFRIDFENGARAAFKPEQINPQTVPRKEIAAYRLNRWLGLNAVPPAVSRKLHRDDLVGRLPPDALYQAHRIDAETLFDSDGYTRGELSFWIPTIFESGLDLPQVVAEWQRWLTVGESIPSGRVSMMRQLSSILLFDLLTNNADRFSGGNLKMSEDARTLYYMDNTFGFQVEPEGHLKCRQALSRAQKFSRALVERMRQLDLNELKRALEPESQVLSEAEMAALLRRRDVALRYVDGLIGEYGASSVLVFP